MRVGPTTDITPLPSALADAVLRSDLVSPWENSNYLACVREIDGAIVAVNQSFARKFGRSTAAWPGRDLASLIHAEDLTNWRTQSFELAQPPHRIEHETRWHTAQGWRWLAWEETALLDENGHPYLYRSIGRDVTKQRLAEHHAYKLTNAVEQSPVSLVIADLDGRVLYVNPKFTSVTGYSLEDVIEQNLAVLKEAHDTQESWDSFWTDVRSVREWRGEVRTRCKDGGILWESVQISPIRNSHGEVTHFLCLREDITERKRLEEQLRQSQKMESLGTLAGGIAHDFNNMLAIINGYTEICLSRLATTGTEDNLRRYLREVHSAAQRAIGLVHRILTFSRKTEVRVAPLSLNKLLRELGSLLAETFPRTIVFDFDLDDSMPSLAADQNQLQQVIMNLCVNARDAMPKGGTLTLTTRLIEGTRLTRLGSDPQQTYACLRVSDTGVGIPPQVRARIFEPFYTTKQDSGGTGLGLAVVYGIVTNHKGLLDVESQIGKGSSFSIYLPVVATEGAQDNASATKRMSELPRGTESILVVEDEASLRNLLVNVLEPSGYRVLCARDGREALEYFENRELEIDAILLDLNMPEMHGLEVYKELQRFRPRTKVLVVSGNISKEVKTEMLKLGQHEFLEKPYRIDEVCRRLRAMLDDR